MQKVIESKPKELAAEAQPQAMIMEIVNACLDILEDAAQAKAAGHELPRYVQCHSWFWNIVRKPRS
jgi:translation initiation factor 2-alpha kinase 4